MVKRKCSLCVLFRRGFVPLWAPVFTLPMFLAAPDLPASCWLEHLPDLLVTEPKLPLACLPVRCSGGLCKSQVLTDASWCLALHLIEISSLNTACCPAASPRNILCFSLNTSLDGRSSPVVWIAASPAFLFHCSSTGPTAAAAEWWLFHIYIWILLKTQINVGWNCFAFESGPFWVFLLCAPSSVINAAASRASLGLLSKKSRKWPCYKFSWVISKLEST